MPSPIFYPLAGLHCVVCMIEYERIRNNIENWKKNAEKCGLVKIMQKVRSVYKNEVNSKINKICRAIESLQKNGIECSVPVYGSDFLEKVYSICLEDNSFATSLINFLASNISETLETIGNIIPILPNLLALNIAEICRLKTFG